MNELISLIMTQQSPSAGCESVFPFFLMILVFYFLLIRPQQKQERERREMLSRLKKGDTVITSGGIIGTINTVKEKEVLIEIADKVKVRISRDDVDLYEEA